LRDGFGADPAFSGLVAEFEGRVIDYLLYHFGYDTDRAIRLMHVVDLFVQEEMRNKSCGNSLMQAADRIGEKAGATELTCPV
jgi:GNAT superfamily N-acetyltransferase